MYSQQDLDFQDNLKIQPVIPPFGVLFGKSNESEKDMKPVLDQIGRRNKPNEAFRKEQKYVTSVVLSSHGAISNACSM